jgi:hypothetical protein
MTRDPLFQKIVAALSGDLDEDAFERCAASLLRDVYATLAPMSGGNDAGFDGAVGTTLGPYPLLATVDRRGPLANVRKNLTAYAGKGDGPKQAVVATPRVVTNKQKRRIEQAALSEFGVRIMNIHDRDYFADRLYRDHRWRLELLGIGGDPEALSALPPRPRTDRPTLIGRDQDLNWLRTSVGDLLLVGQPGFGKTYLHEALVRDGLALFAVDRERGRLANALRALQPKIVIVDDAQGALDLIQTLRGLRAELGFPFYIHANCWSRSEAEVRASLEVSNSSVRTLGALTRTEILEVIKEMGIHGPDSVLHLLLDQAEGKPGLAAALVAAVRRGDLDRVWSGEAIAESLLHSRQLLKNPSDLHVLASFALAGDRGASVSEVAATLGVSALQVSSTIENLAAGGVVEEVMAYEQHRIAVRPLSLRGVLVRDAFFKGPARLDPSALVERFRNDRGRIGGVAESLFAARQRGGEVSNDLLLGIAIEADSNAAWRHFGYVDSSLDRMLIRQYPDAIPQAAEGLLSVIPDDSLPHLVGLVLDADKTKRDVVQRAFKSWSEGNEPGDPVSVPRRRQLLAAVRDMKLGSTAAVEGFQWLLALVIKVDVDMHVVRPGSGREVVIYSGLRPLDQLQAIADLWPEVVALLHGTQSLSTDVRGAIDDWCFPVRHAQANTPSDVLEFAKGVGARMLTDLQQLPACNRACRGWIKRTARRAGLDVTVSVDRLFQRIFEPPDHSSDWQTQQRRRAVVLDAVARQMVEQGPEAAVRELAELEREAAGFGSHGGYDRFYLYHRIAQSVTDVGPWLDVVVREGLPAEYVQPFVGIALQKGDEKLEGFIAKLMDDDHRGAYGITTSLTVLSMPRPPEDLLNAALASFELRGHRTTFALVNAAPTEETTIKLLNHANRDVRVHAAFAEWLREPKGQVRPALRVPWRAAILEARDEYEHLLGEVLSADQRLAVEWALSRMDEAAGVEAVRSDLWKLEDIFEKVVEGLDRDQRWTLLERLPMAGVVDKILDTLMRGDSELFRRWLRLHLDSGDPKGRYLALRPLDRDVDEVWESFAVTAADEGVSDAELAEHVTGRPGQGMSGPFSAFYLALLPAFERLADHPDPRLRLAGRRGIDWARASADRELREERQEAIRGL